MAVNQKDYVLVSMDTNWADEFDVEGFLVVSTAYFEDAKKRLLGMEEGTSFSMGFGTNQDLTWHDAEELLASLTVKPLDDAEVALFEKHFRLAPTSYYFSASKREMTEMQRLAFTARHILAGYGKFHFLDGLGTND
jgi:hypothetical protein